MPHCLSGFIYHDKQNRKLSQSIVALELQEIFYEHKHYHFLNTTKNILICPLDWGLGHATRCVPVIAKFVEAGANVIIGADNRPLAFLKKEFPSLQFIQFPGYEIRYPEKGSMALKMLRSIPRILRRIKQERKFLEKIVSEYNIDAVVSDNRYGLWNKKVKTVFITHQLLIKCPGFFRLFQNVLLYLNRHYIHKFDECWVPDFKGYLNIAGSLTNKHHLFKNVHFIGMLSRFKKQPLEASNSYYDYDVLFVLSGPEPQRTVFENLILEQIKLVNIPKALIIRGIPESNESRNIADNIQMVDHLGSDQFEKTMIKSKLVICRPGYSSIMDIVTLGKNVVFVATPGQTEQEYLGRYYANRNLCYSMSQKKFDLSKVLQKSTFYNGIKIKNTGQELLAERIRLLLT